MNNFQRGIDPKVSIGLGYREIFKSMERCYLFTEADLYQNVDHQYHSIETVSTQNIRKRNEFIFSALIIIIAIGDKFRIMKNRFFRDNDKIYPIGDLPKIIFELKELYDDYMIRKNNNYE
jgi:hypothetical protein